MVDGVFSRAFKTGVRPVELGRRMVREMDEHRSVDVHGRRIVPNQFAFFLSPTDIATFSGIQDALIDELVESAKDYAAQEGYYFMGPVTVDFVERSEMKTGRFAVVSQMREDAGRPRPAAGYDQPAYDDGWGGTQYEQPLEGDEFDVPDDAYADPSAAGGYPASDQGEGTDASLDVNPWAPVGAGSRPAAPPVALGGSPAAAPGRRAQPHLTLENGDQVELGDEPAIIGRLAGCAIVVSDLNVSRRHAQVRRAGSVFVVADLGSTNGTLVNGSRIDGETVLHDGDVIAVGATQIRFEAS